MNKLHSKSFLILPLLLVLAGTAQSAQPLFTSSITGSSGSETKTSVCTTSNQRLCYSVSISGGTVAIQSNSNKAYSLTLDIPEGYKISGCDSIQNNKCHFKLGPKQSASFTVIIPDSPETSIVDQIQEDAAQQSLESSIQEQQTNTIIDTIGTAGGTAPVNVPVCTYDSAGHVIVCN